MKQTLIVVLSVVAYAGQKGGPTSSDPSVTWTIYSGHQAMLVQPLGAHATCDPATTGCTASAINGDGSIYINNSYGVSNSVIHMSEGTYDATLLVSAPRSISFNLQSQVYSLSSSQPAWATSIVAGAGLLNVSHLVEGTALGDLSEHDYSTRLTSLLPLKGAYHLRMDNPGATELEASYYGSFQYNDPYLTALVWVHHCPDTTNHANLSSQACPSGHKESWYVYPDARTQQPNGAPIAQVSTLVDGDQTITGIAQYATPFFFKIELQ